MPKSRPTILFIVHSWGGGTIRFARELADLISDKVGVVWAWGVENKSFHLSQRGPYSSEQDFDLAEGFDAPLLALKSYKPRRANVIHTIGLENHIALLLERLGIPYDVTFTDYHYFSDTPHFDDDSGRFIGDAAAIAKMRNRRENPSPLLRMAERHIAVSQDLALRTAQLIPGLPLIPIRISEPNNAVATPIKFEPFAPSEMMRVLILGRPHPTKGLATVVKVALRAEREQLPIEIFSLGESSPEHAGQLNRLSRVRVLGAYAQEDLGKIVARIKPHLAWFPFNIPETHSYALSDAMSFGLPVLATGIGAVAERVAGRPSTWLVPFDKADADAHFQWLSRLYDDRLQTPSAHLPVHHLPPVVEGFFPDVYLDPLMRWRLWPMSWLRRTVRGRASRGSPGQRSNAAAGITHATRQARD